MYFLLGISLIMALLLVINLLVSATIAILWQILAPAAKNWTPRSRARIIFGLRVFPFGAALIFVSAFLLPAYLLFEPHSSEEIVSGKLALLAAASVICVGLAAWRVFGTWWRTRRLVVNWLARAELISTNYSDISVYRINHPYPVIAVVGIFRPRIFIAGQIFRLLDDNELQAAMRHEYGHLVAHDNLKRTLMRFCYDLLIFPIGRGLDRAWTKNTESAADEYAAQTGKASAALDLASALVKIARSVPHGTKPAVPAGAFLIETQSAEILWRVRHLLDFSELSRTTAKYRLTKSENIFWLYAGGICGLILIFATDYGILYKTHLVLESVVKFLQ